MNFKLRLFLTASGRCCAVALLLILLGASSVHAQPVNPNIDLAGPPCPAQPQLPQITYGAKPGETLTNVEIGIKTASGQVFWSLSSGKLISSGCTGTGSALQCAPNSATPPGDFLFNVTAPTGAADPTQSAGRVQIKNNRAITTADVNNRSGTFGVTATLDVPSGSPSCQWNYLIHVVNPGDTGGWGDPHMTTVEGIKYDFQSAGEFTALKEDGFEVQTRQRPVPGATVPGPSDYTGLGVCVATYSAVAMRIGSNRVTLQPDLSGQPNPSGLQLRVNGKLVELTDRGIDLWAGGSSTVTSATTAALEGRITKTADGSYEFDNAFGTQLVATPAWWDAQKTWYLNLKIYQTSASKGIWGALASDSSNPYVTQSWLPALPDGTSLGSKPQALDQRYQELYVKFANAWRVTDATSLFDYAPGTNTATFTVADWPRFQAKSCDIRGQTSAQPATQQVAEQACNGVTDPGQKANCTFDVMVTGNTGFGDSYRTMQGFKPHGTGWQPPLAGTPTKANWPWWWWIVLVILVLIVIAVLIARK